MFLAKIADFVTPGSMIATRIPNGASSWASPSLNPSNAHFEVTYGDWASAAMRPVTEVMLTMRPDATLTHLRAAPPGGSGPPRTG